MQGLGLARALAPAQMLGRQRLSTPCAQYRGPVKQAARRVLCNSLGMARQRSPMQRYQCLPPAGAVCRGR